MNTAVGNQSCSPAASSAVDVDFVGIGSGKCGSTWIYANIVQHPAVFSGNLKELNYFSDLYDTQGPEWYGSQFHERGETSALVKGEFSVTYLQHPRAAQRILQDAPNAKVIAILRNPIDRTFSNYLHSIRKGIVAPDMPFATFIGDSENLKPAMYAQHLQRYFSIFPAQNIKVLLLEEFTKEPETSFKDLYRFLGIDPEFSPSNVREKVNGATMYRNMGLESLLIGTYRWLSVRGHTKLVKKIVDSGAANVVRKMNSKENQSIPGPSEEERKQLSLIFEEPNKVLETLLQRSITVW